MDDGSRGSAVRAGHHAVAMPLAGAVVVFFDRKSTRGSDDGSCLGGQSPRGEILRLLLLPLQQVRCRDNHWSDSVRSDQLWGRGLPLLASLATTAGPQCLLLPANSIRFVRGLPARTSDGLWSCLRGAFLPSPRLLPSALP